MTAQHVLFFERRAAERRDAAARFVLDLTSLALEAKDVPSAVRPALEALVARTAAAGAAYFQADGALRFLPRSASGEMPVGPAMDAILAHGLPSEAPLLRALEAAEGPMFFDDTAASPEAEGFPDLGVKSLAACPVRGPGGGFLGAFLMHTLAPHEWTTGEAELFGAVAGTLAALTGRLAAEERALSARESALRALGMALEARDRETKGHTDRVTDLAMRVGAAVGLKGERLEGLRWGAYLHDVGKLAVPDAVLLKPGSLDAAEWVLMRSHSPEGHRFAEALGFLPEGALNVVRHHHERWDGAGYPDGLSGPDIPLEARVFAVCDVYDALTSERPYKRAWTEDEAAAEIEGGAGRHFDPAVVGAFLAILRS